MKEYVKIEDIKPYLQRAVSMAEENHFDRFGEKPLNSNQTWAAPMHEIFSVHNLHYRDVTGCLRGTKKNGQGKPQVFIGAEFFDKVTLMLDDRMAADEVDYYTYHSGTEYRMVGSESS